ncbi:MAG TPA: hypothetical protein VFT34_01410 [Verrucomicrobiae bacterium]|nr:hypothetical protein [Verrucomicrobiae bacterium]
MESINSNIGEQPGGGRGTSVAEGGWLRGWGRWLLAGNPCYLVSAALLLFGINRLAVDPEFLKAEGAKLGFNFSALQVYELLVVGVAILLARRRVWYDSTLLVVIENLLVLVPFILITQAVLIGPEYAAALCGAAALLALARLGALKRWMGELDLSPRFLVVGALMLAANLVTPVLFRGIIENGTDKWELPALVGWLCVLPLFLAAGNLLPEPREPGGIAPRRSWLPLLILGLWVTGSAAHLYCVGYVSDLAFHPWMLTPLTLVLAWTAWRRLPDLRPQPVALQSSLRQALLVFAALTPLLAATAPSSGLFFALTILNSALFGWVRFADPRNKLAGQLALASGVALLAGLPIEWGLWLAPGFTRVRAIELCLGGYVVLQALRSRQPAWGLCGAMAAALAPAVFSTGFNGSLALHVGLSFLVLHSLRWDERISKGVVGLRIGTAVSWMTHAFVWTRVDGGTVVLVISSAAVLILLTYVLLGVVTGQWGARVVPAGAALSFLAAPANSFFDLMRASPAGLLAVLGSFALFGLGTLAALMKHRWHPVAVSASDGEQP